MVTKKIIAKKRKPFLLECSDGKVLYSLGVLFCAEFDHALLVGTKHFSLPSFVVVGGLFNLATGAANCAGQRHAVGDSNGR